MGLQDTGESENLHTHMNNTEHGLPLERIILNCFAFNELKTFHVYRC